MSAIGQRPGVYDQTFDNSITPAIGGLGGIGVPVRLEKGEIGVPLACSDRDTLIRLGGKPISGFNTEDYAYVDNMFYYTGNVILSRVEDIVHSYKVTTGAYITPCENAQAIFYSNGVGINANNKFNFTAITKELPSTGRSAAWTNFVTNFIGEGDDPENIDFAMLILNALSDVQEAYVAAVDTKKRYLHSGSIALIRDAYGEYDANSLAIMQSFVDGSIIAQKNGDNITAVAKVANVNKAAVIPYADYFPASERWNVGDRVFVIQRVAVGADLPLEEGTYIIDESATSPYLEVGVVIANGAGDVTIKYTSDYVISDGDVLIALTDAEIDASIVGFEREQILNALEALAVERKLGYEDSGDQDDYGYIATVDISTASETVVFNYVNLNESKKIVDGTSDLICYSNFTKIETVTINITEGNIEEFCRAIAKTPGRWADRGDVEVMVVPMNEVNGESMFDVYASQYFDFKPEAGSTTTYALDQLAVVVFVGGSVAEKYIVSVNPSAKDADGNSKHFNDVINNSSQYMYLGINPDFIDIDNYVIDSTLIASYVPQRIALIGGNSSTAIYPLRTVNAIEYSVQWGSVQAVKEALKVFENKSAVALEYIADGAFAGQPQIKDAIVNLVAQTRRDCVAGVGPRSTAFRGVQYPNEGYARLADYKTWINSGSDNQYVAFFANTKQVYDSFNDQIVWISCSSDGVGLNSRVDRLQERWYAVAGPRRGVLTNIIKLGWFPDDTSRESMTKDRLNPIIYEPGEGYMIYDTMSMCSLNSDLSEFYNRKTLNYLQVNTERYLKKVVFEFNDADTRAEIVDALTPFYRSVYTKRGLAEPALIQCDGKNNPASVIASGICYVDIIIKLQRCIKRLVARYRITAQTATLEFVTEE